MDFECEFEFADAFGVFGLCDGVGVVDQFVPVLILSVVVVLVYE